MIHTKEIIKRIISSILATSMIIGTTPAVFASDTIITPGNSKSDAVLSAEGATFNITIPTVLPITVTSTGEVITSNEIKLTNQSSGPVIVSEVTVAPQNSWKLIDFSKDFSKSKIGLREFGLEFRGEALGTTGQVDANSWGTIGKGGELQLDYNANIAPQKDSLVDTVIANVIFTVGWSEVDIIPPSGGVTDEPNDFEFTPGDDKIVTFKFENVTDDTITWNSSDETVAIVEPILTKGRSVLLSGEAKARIKAVGAGVATITASTGDGFTQEIEVAVKGRELLGIKIAKQPDKVEYRVGEVFDTSGIIVMAEYNNGTSEEIVSGGYTYDTAPLISGITSIEIKYNDKIVNQAITVLALQGGNITSNYPIGVAFTPTDEQMLTFNYENIKEEDERVIWSSSNESVATVTTVESLNDNRVALVDGKSQAEVVATGIGTTVITATTSDGFSKSIGITVVEKEVTKLEIVKAPSKIVYKVGSIFDTTGMEVKATYNNGKSGIITDYTYNKEGLTLGTTSIEISYGGKVASQAIEVQPLATGTITDSFTGEYAYTPGDIRNLTFDFQNADSNEVTWESSDINVATVEKTVLGGLNRLFNGNSSAKVTAIGMGTATITATTKDGFKKEVRVAVEAKEVGKLAIVKEPTKTQYVVGEIFNPAGMIVEACYNNGSREIIVDYEYSDKPLQSNDTGTIIYYRGGEAWVDLKVEELPVDGEKYTDEYYEYRYREDMGGWQVYLLNRESKEYTQPLEMIKGRPVVSYEELFAGFGLDTLNLAGTWNNTYVTNMSNMFMWSRAGNILFEDFKTDKVENMYGMFTGCETPYLDLSSFDTGNVTTMQNMFVQCYSTEVNLSSFNTSKVTNMRQMFSQSMIKELDLSSFDTSNVTAMEAMFWDCTATTGYARNKSEADKFNSTETDAPSNLVFVTKGAPVVGEIIAVGNYKYTYTSTGWAVSIIDKTQTSYVQPLEEIKGKPVTSYVSLFYEYPNTTLTLEGTWTNSNVTNMNTMFYGCKATTLDLSSFNTTNVTSMSAMFRECKATTLNLSNFNTNNVTNMNTMFKYSEATTLDLGSFNTSKVTNMGWMFERCKAVTLDLSSFNTSKVTTMNSMFQNSRATTGYARTQADLDRFNATENKPSTLYLFIKGTPVVGEVVTAGNYNYTYRVSGWKVEVIDKTQTVYKQPLEEIKGKPVTSYSGMFTGYDNRTTPLVLEGTWTNRNITDMSNMFKDAKTSGLSLLNFKTNNVTNMSGMFDWVYLESGVLDLSSFNTSRVKNMSGMFRHVGLASLDVSSFDTSNVTNMSNMFYYFVMKGLDLSSFNTSNVTDMTGMFIACSTDVLDLTSFDTNKVLKMKDMFNYCYATEIDMSSFTIDYAYWEQFVTTYGTDMLKDCKNLKTLYVGNNIIASYMKYSNYTGLSNTVSVVVKANVNSEIPRIDKIVQLELI